MVLYRLHHFEEGLIDILSLFLLKKGVIMIVERLNLAVYTVLANQNHPVVFQNGLQSYQNLVKI